MTVSLTQPEEDSVGWAAAVNQNFQDIEDALNLGGNYAYGYVLYAQAAGGGPTASVPVPSTNELADGETFHFHAWGTCAAGTVSLSFDGDVLASNVSGGPNVFSIHAAVRRVGATTRVSAWFDSDGGSTLNVDKTLTSFSGEVSCDSASGEVYGLQVYRTNGQVASVLTAPDAGTLVPGVVTMLCPSPK